MLTARAWVTGVFVLLAIGVSGSSEQSIRTSPVLEQATALATKSIAVRAALGSAVAVGMIPRGTIEDEREYGYASISAPLKGTKGSGTLYAVANRLGRAWIIQRAAVHIDGPEKRRIDITPPPAPEPLRYVKPGRVYLLPLDEAARTDIAELPRYFKARMNVAVTILPTEDLPDDVIDKTSKQVVAETALDRIEGTHPAISGDVDAAVLAVTSRDMNARTWSLPYAVNFRHGRVGLVATARLHERPHVIENPEEYPVRVRKTIVKNVALMHFPVGLTDDWTSAIAYGPMKPEQVDMMGENFGGEDGTARLMPEGFACLVIVQRRGGPQSWTTNCDIEARLDRRLDAFATFPLTSEFFASHTDFPLEGRRPFTFIREYTSRLDKPYAFGLGGGHSFDIWPAGNSFEEIDLVLGSGHYMTFKRTSPGRSYVDAKLLAEEHQGNPFSMATMEWNKAVWDVTTRDGWTYTFPPGAGRTWPELALRGIRSRTGAAFSLKRDAAGALQELRAPGGDVIRFDVNAQHAIVAAADASGRKLRYEYDTKGRLIHVIDPESGDVFYVYDARNHIARVLDARRRVVLANTYGDKGEIRSQTLADGRRFAYRYTDGADGKVDRLVVTLPDGYVIDWQRTSEGYVASLPHLPAQK